jgi:2-polyprenyl-6-methoxyphenol hydroxylase-like FAD-dependent oxidoreductase
MQNMVPKRIAVIGGGLGGLAFAQAMRNTPGFQVIVFERDRLAENRSQGYQIGIHGYGLPSLKRLQVRGVDELLAENPMNGVMITDQHFTPYVRFPTGTASLVNRWKLRDLLLQDVQVEYNKRFLRYEIEKDHVRVYFLDGTEIEVDLVVGADGARSKLRQQYRPDLQFHSTGVGAIAGYFELKNDNNNNNKNNNEKTNEGIHAIVANNLVRAQLSHRHSLLCMRFMANHTQSPHLLWAVSYDKQFAKQYFGADLPTPTEGGETGEEGGADNQVKQQEKLKEVLLQRLSDSPQPVQQLVIDTPAENIFLQKEYWSMIPKWQSHVNPNNLLTTHPNADPNYPRVTLLGDAAHVMTSHAGLGANTAFKDAVDLADIIKDKRMGLHSQENWKQGHALYEKDMFTRGYKAITASITNTKRIHGDPSATAIAFLKFMGFWVKTFNYFKTGKFSF